MMDMQLESCFREIDRMQYTEVVEEDLMKLKSQMVHSYKFGSTAQHICKTLNIIIKLLKTISSKINKLIFLMYFT
jgi:hypothetical protein